MSEQSDREDSDSLSVSLALRFMSIRSSSPDPKGGGIHLPKVGGLMSRAYVKKRLAEIAAQDGMTVRELKASVARRNRAYHRKYSRIEHPSGRVSRWKHPKNTVRGPSEREVARNLAQVHENFAKLAHCYSRRLPGPDFYDMLTP